MTNMIATLYSLTSCALTCTISPFRSFYEGDCYIVLWTYTEGLNPALRWNIHYWIGKTSSIDEGCIAAYKTVELDDKLGGLPVQYREAQGQESALFLSYFNNYITIMAGGVDSGMTFLTFWLIF